ncbi:MAG: helix-turn-helix domain-containing protein [Acidobacteriota bacterium]
MALHQHTHPPTEAFLTPTEVLRTLRVNARTLYRLMSEGTLPAVRIGRQWRVRPRDFELWLRRQAVDGRGAITPWPPEEPADSRDRLDSDQAGSNQAEPTNQMLPKSSVVI